LIKKVLKKWKTILPIYQQQEQTNSVPVVKAWWLS